jgi:CBS domain-containing protein
VIARTAPHRLVGIVTRSDLLAAYRPRIDESARTARGLGLRPRRRGRRTRGRGAPAQD